MSKWKIENGMLEYEPDYPHSDIGRTRYPCDEGLLSSYPEGSILERNDFVMIWQDVDYNRHFSRNMLEDPEGAYLIAILPDQERPDKLWHDVIDVVGKCLVRKEYAVSKMYELLKQNFTITQKNRKQ